MVICPGRWHHEAMPERLSSSEAAATARHMWTLFEPVHAVSYFAAEPKAAFETAARPWSRLTPGRAAEFAELLRTVALACARALPFPALRAQLTPSES
jgi:hypothetical protein